MRSTNPVLEQIARERSRLAGKRFARSVKEKLHFLLRLRAFINEDRQKKPQLSWRHTLRAWRHGFERFHYKLFALDQGGDPTQYVSDFSMLLAYRDINGRFSEMVNNKYAFGRMMSLMGMPTPAIKGVIVKGAFYPLDAARAIQAADFLQAAFVPGERLVLKPIWGYHGFGFICLARENDGWRVNNEKTPAPLVAGMIGKLDDYLVTEFVNQGEFSSTLYPLTPNTIRMVTMWDDEKMEAFVARAVLRIGTSRSFPVDNFKAGQGGLSALIDLAGGELGPGAMADGTGKPVWHTIHPESHAPIQGVVVPAWNELQARILEYAGRFAFIPCIGWDIILTDKGFSILEGNSTPGMPVLQIHGPLLADPRIARFYRRRTP
ncbi:MAG TPA: sugar-transfer associated ATP-grasp domain-containing protein [Candidatus Binatia bacterium]|nr:sugar-transfer associated ATP-grasp domain-containing protein [Candidatus Binatia bacterium]